MRTIEAVLQLRRDNDFNFNKIKDTFIPANGEVILVDTAKDGLRAKVGNGYSTYAELSFTDADLRSTVQQGYYKDDVFYRDITLNTPSPRMINKIYIDLYTDHIYYYNGEHYARIQEKFPYANSETAGMMKLYSTTGNATDGTMTQKAITDELELRYKASIDSDEELLIFSL